MNTMVEELLLKRAEDAEEKLRIARETLEHYANTSNWNKDEYGDDAWWCPIFDDSLPDDGHKLAEDTLRVLRMKETA